MVQEQNRELQEIAGHYGGLIGYVVRYMRPLSNFMGQIVKDTKSQSIIQQLGFLPRVTDIPDHTTS